MANRDQFNRGMILPTLIKQLRSILQQYPDDGQILKELIQNAEDARARRIVFLLDSTTFSAQPEKLYHPDLAAYQGPALYVYNDAVFTSDDWKGITMLSDSVKEKDPMKVGRFGLGFKSIFHLTDLPSIFSGNGIGFLDPHERFFRTGDRGYPTSAFLWDLNSDADNIKRLQDQFLPFFQSLFGVTQETFERGLYEGTMFRFPLRMEGMQSDLSDTKYSLENVRELFRSLETDGHIMLLFLKSLECIEVYEKTSNTDNPRKILSINISETVRNSVREKRLQLIKDIETQRNGNISDSISITYALNVELQRHQIQDNTHQNTKILYSRNPLETSQWVISQYYAGRSELRSVSAISDDLGLLPWVAVALPITDQNNSENLSYMKKPKGHIFCFLPLPLEEESPTGLRVHVHGYFAVDSNRRHIKWPTADQRLDQLTDKALLWNEFLVNELLVKALVKLALYVVQPCNNLHHDLIFDIIPDHVTPQWKQLADGFYKELPNLSVFYSQSSGGKWLNCKNAIFDNCEDKSVLQELIRRILIQNQVSFVSTPLFLKKHFANQLSPMTVCQAFKPIQKVVPLSEQEKFLILEYFLDNFPRGIELIGIQLVPLADGTWTEFSNNYQAKVYIDSSEHPKSILPNLDKMFVRLEISVLQKMKNLAYYNVTQLVNLGPEHVAGLLQSVFPPHWCSVTEISLGSAPHLSQKWLTDLWTYLARHFPYNLQPFENFLILPIGNGLVTRLRSQTPIILASYVGTALAVDTKSVLIKLGLKVIEDLPITILAHQSLMGNYVLPPDITNVLSAMNTLYQKGMLLTPSMNDSHKKSLQNFLASGLAGQPITTLNRNLLMTLPIFKTVDGSEFKSSQYVSLNSVNQGAPQNIILPVKLPSMFIDLNEHYVRDLAVKLGVVEKTVADVLESCVFPAVARDQYDSDSIRRLMSFVCDNFPRFQKESRNNFHSSVSNVRFIQKQDGGLVTPKEVFDKSDQTLCSLFAGDDVFPVGEFANSKYLYILRKLGLKAQSSVTAADLLGVAEKLSSSISPDISRAQTFLNFLESNSQLLNTAVMSRFLVPSSLSNALSNIRWINPESCRPSNYAKSLEFIGEAQSKQLVLPSDVCSSQFNFVVGSVRSTINISKTPKVAKCFHWSNSPNVDDVVQHLCNVVSSYSAEQKVEVQLIVKAVYRFLNESIASSLIHGTKLNQLNCINWIWTGDNLVSSGRVVKTKPFMDLQPHVYQLPQDLKEFSYLWNHFQIAEKVDLIKILNEINSLHTTSACDQSQVKRDVQFAVAILNNISIMGNRNEILDELLVPIKTNDEKLRMKPIQEVTYCDKEWFQRGLDVQDLVDDDVFLVHPLLSPETAEALKIHGIISRVLDAEELGVGFESYGQSEGLTTRLNSILKDYTDGMAVLKELVQNADDAGATEVKFLYDQRQNDDSKTLLFDKEMAGLQGPALWEYNDAVFSSQDFENLVKLSGATKEENNEKIGRFGLGFNAVYNLTDVPSLVSQNFAVFLDPHTKYLGRAIRDKSKPGIKLDVGNNRKKLQPMKDQFKPYNGIFGCDFSKVIATNDITSNDGSYPGTLFRFPLRTPQQASTSDICKTCYSHQELMTLLKLLESSGSHLLLFTQNVRKITVFHLPENASPNGIEEWFTIEKNLEQTIRSLNQHSQLMSNDANELTRESSILKVANRMLKSSQNYILNIESSFILKVVCKTSAKFPKLPVSSSGVSESHWLVSSCLGRSGSLEMAKRNKDLIPVGGVAAKLRRGNEGYEPISLSSGEKPSDDSGLLYCFLPLPIRSCFPVHINGSFALTSSRTHIYENTVEDKTDRRSQWNEVLIKDAITEAYLILLEDLLKVCGSCNSYILWPVHKSLKEAGCFSMLTDALYRRIFDAGPKILRENGLLLSMSECRYLESKFRQESAGETAIDVLRKMYLLGFHVTDIPANVYATVATTSALQQLEARKMMKMEFFQSYFLPNIQMVEAKQRDTLILLSLSDQNLIALLKNVACVPVKPKRILKMCSQLVHPKSFLAVLFDEEDECFPDFKEIPGIKLNDVYGKLVELGMRERDLSWEQTSERCLVITKNEKLVMERLDTILRLMSSKSLSVNNSDLPFIERIKEIQFLPISVKPKGFPLKWKGEKMKYASCNESFLSNVKNLVCSLYPIINDHTIFGYEDHHHKLKALLGLANKPIHQTDLLLQLKNVLELVSDSSGSTNGLTVDGMKYVKEICNDLYTRFENLASKHELLESTVDELLDIKSILIDVSMVFMSPRNCSLTLGVSSESLLPYLAPIPKSMSMLRHLLVKLQIKERFKLEDYIDVLQQLHTTFEDTPLEPKELQMALCIVNSCLLPEITKLRAGGEASVDLAAIYVPDLNGVLFPAESLCYNNCQWIDAEDHHFCNGEINPKAAMAIGMKTIREDVIDRYSIGIPFGQKEKLVNRIRRILSGYPFDKEVLKEMLQNADDAKATEIHFINDRRQLKTERVFEDKWKPLQGPALCIFNDKPFTNEDIKGIQNLGEGSKSEDPTKTGQYGVGFNCVYHMTDAPTFLTNVVGGDEVERVLCAFDPTLRFVPGAKETNPGRMMNKIDQLKKKFPDVFQGYFENDYGSLGGTMFRLSLRNKVTAEQPGCVTSKAVTPDDVKKLFETFKTDMYESLLFLNSVKQIHLRNAKCIGDSTELTTEYIVEVEMTAEVMEKRNKFNEEVKLLSKALKNKEVSLKNVGVIETSYELITKDNDGQRDTWQIIQRFGFEDASCVSDSLNNAYSSGDIGLLPRCGVAHLKRTTRKKVDRNRRLFCFLPLPVQTHFPSHINGHFALDHETRRNLWSDENGGYKTEWNKCVMKHIVAPCYCSLLLEIRDFLTIDGPVTQSIVYQYNSLLPDICPQDGIYMTILSEAIYERIGKKNLAVLPVRWPAKENQHLWIGPCGMDAATWKMWNDLGWDGSVGTNGILGYFDSLSSEIKEPPEPSTSGYRLGSISVSSKVKTEQKKKRSEIQKKKRFEIVRETLVASGFLLINCPMSVSGNFNSAKIEVKAVDPDSILSFFASYGQPNSLCRLHDLPKPLIETLFKDLETLNLLLAYCTRCEGYKGRLFGLPFLLTTDGQLRYFERESIKYEPFFNEIVPHIQDQFFNYDIFHTLHLDATTDTELSKAFTIEQFAKALPSLLPPDQFKAVTEPVNVQTLKVILNDKDLKWLLRLWKFLHSCHKKLESEAKSRQSSESVINTILPLHDWCLLPVSFRKQEYLFPIEKSRSVIKFGKQETLNSCLQKIGVPQPLYKYFPIHYGTGFEDGSSHMYCQILGTMDDASSIVLALEEVLRYGAIEAEISRHECEELCRHLAKSLDEWKETPYSIDTVRQLPIFTTMYDRQVALLNSCVYVIPAKIPKIDMESWTAKRGIIFLKSNEDISKLLEFLGCKALSETEVYCSYIFQHFEMLSKDGQRAHLTYIRDRLLTRLMSEPYKEKAKHRQEREQERDALLESLQTLAFIPRDDSYVCASEFFDNQNEVFKLMQEPSDFPPEPYDSIDWSDFLKKCGMISVVNQTMFLDYARQVENRARIVIDDELRNQSMKLVSHLFSRDDVQKTDFMNSVKIIEFVEPFTLGAGKKNLHCGCGKKNKSDQDMFISFKNSIICENADLVWTAQNVLPAWTVLIYGRSQDIIGKLLDIQTKAKPEKVAEHIKRLCTKWAPEVYKLQPHAALMGLVLKKCYHHLKSSLSEDVLTILRDTACIFDSKNCLLVRPGQVVLRWKPNKEISPYLIRNPDELGEFVDFFQQLGSTPDNATIDQYCMVLEMIHDAAKDNKLDPNEKEAACKATCGFFKLLKQKKDPITLERELFFPGTDEKLHRSSEIIVNNNYLISQRMGQFEQTFLIDLKECKMQLLDYELEMQIKKLPAGYQPQFLTSVIVETMEQSFTVEDSGFARILERRLQSDEMKEGIMRIAWHGVKEKEKETEQRILDAVEGVKNVKFLGVNTILTFLVCKGHRINSSERSRHFYIQEELAEEKRCTIFVGSTLLRNEVAIKMFYHRIARIVHQFTGCFITYDALSYLEHILQCNEQDVGMMLDHHDIRRLQNFERKFRPTPGQFVPIDLHHLLKQDILLFKIGDYVALEIDDPADNISTLSQDETTNPADGTHETADGDDESNDMMPTYILVKILEAFDKESGPTVATYRIFDGKGVKTVSAVLLYAFHRTATNAQDVDAILQVDDQEVNVTVTLDEAKREIRQTLLDTWKLREDIRKKSVKRLLLKWHPDKNPDRKQLATEATQYIFEVLEKLSKGIPVEDNLPYSTQSSSSDFYSSSDYSGAYYNYISRRARNHRKAQERFQENYTRNTENVDERRRRDFIKSFSVVSRNPQPGEGRRWLRQAEWDLKSVVNDGVDGKSPSPEWASFKCYQAAIKALKGARYARDSNTVSGDDLKDMAEIFEKVELHDWVKDLQRLLTSPSFMQYPTDHHQPMTPHDVITIEIAQKAQVLSQNIVEWCRRYID